jgi:hypothetical protein
MFPESFYSLVSQHGMEANGNSVTCKLSGILIASTYTPLNHPTLGTRVLMLRGGITEEQANALKTIGALLDIEVW